MQKYVDRLIECGYSPEKARSLCHDIGRNLGIVDLENLIESIEKEKKRPCGENTILILLVET